jgi:threonine dehydratase
MPNSYIKRILDARVYDVAIETPIDEARRLSARFDNRILLKREDLQPIFSFKLRGAYNKMAGLTAAERARGVITASAGQVVKSPAQLTQLVERNGVGKPMALVVQRGGQAISLQVTPVELSSLVPR